MPAAYNFPPGNPDDGHQALYDAVRSSYKAPSSGRGSHNRGGSYSTSQRQPDEPRNMFSAVGRGFETPSYDPRSYHNVAGSASGSSRAYQQQQPGFDPRNDSFHDEEGYAAYPVRFSRYDLNNVAPRSPRSGSGSANGASPYGNNGEFGETLSMSDLTAKDSLIGEGAYANKSPYSFSTEWAGEKAGRQGKMPRRAQEEDDEDHQVGMNWKRPNRKVVIGIIVLICIAVAGGIAGIGIAIKNALAGKTVSSIAEAATSALAAPTVTPTSTTASVASGSARTSTSHTSTAMTNASTNASTTASSTNTASDNISETQSTLQQTSSQQTTSVSSQATETESGSASTAEETSQSRSAANTAN